MVVKENLVGHHLQTHRHLQDLPQCHLIKVIYPFVNNYIAKLMVNQLKKGRLSAEKLYI